MTYSIASNITPATVPAIDLRIFLAASVFILLATVFSFAQISVYPTESTITVDDAPEMEVFSYGKTVIVKNQAKGVLAVGGDVIVEGKVLGDVATIGGSVIQKEGAYIGGDVIILGGKYEPASREPLREEGKETVMIAGYEEELRNLSQNPTSLLSPQLSLTFLAQRMLSVFFWFVVSLGLTTLAPGAVSRSIARFQLSASKVIAIGVLGFLTTTIAVVGSLSVLPNYLSAIFSLMAFVLLMLAYVFGRVALHVSVGKLLQKYFLSESNNSETLAILIGVVAWTVILSVPYLWTLALFVLFAAGIGLVLTARSPRAWHTR